MPAGQVWTIDGLVETDGNVIVYGTLVMRAGDTLRFIEVDESAFVGGNTEPLATDVGLWVEGDGVLDAVGTPKTAWNRTGTDPSWSHSDDLVVAPTATGDFGTNGFASFTMGAPVPEAEGHTAEVLNLTRDVNIEGTPSGRAHILIRSTRPQRIEYVTVRHMGPRQPDGAYTDDVAGRNPLHFHMAGDGSRGSIVRGVVVRDAGAHAFVPHLSHGITFEDTIAYNVFESAYWWPGSESSTPGHESHDISYIRAVAALVKTDPAFRGYRLTGFSLLRGSGNVVRDSVAVGVQGNKGASGFLWPSERNGFEGIWTFQDNLAHNNKVNAVFVWQNNSNAHHVERLLSYRNGAAGIAHGAYRNHYRFSGHALRAEVTGIVIHALGASFENCTVEAVTGVRFVKHTLTSNTPTLFSSCDFRTSGTAVVFEEGTGEPSHSEFLACTVNGRPMRPSDFDLSGARPGTTVWVENVDGSSFSLSA